MPDGNAAAQRVLGIAKVLYECGYDIRFCGLKRNILTPESGVIEGFTYTNYAYPTSPDKWLKYLIGRDQSVQEIEKYNPDIVILYNHPAFAIEHIAEYCHNKGINVLADITEWYAPVGNPIFKLIKGYDTNRRMYKSHLKLEGLICISSYLADFYRKRGVKVIEIPPLVDIRQHKWHQQFEKNNNEVRIVYAGSTGVNKDRLDLIIAALDKVIPTLNKRIRFDVIGITKEQYQTIWKDKINHSFVVFHGRKPHEEVIKKLLEADFQIFLRPDNLPNRAGFPTKFAETITSGTLPITNLSSNLKDYLIDGKTGFIVKGLDQESIHDTIIKALSIGTQELAVIKANINNMTFDFTSFISPLKAFLSTIRRER